MSEDVSHQAMKRLSITGKAGPGADRQVLLRSETRCYWRINAGRNTSISWEIMKVVAGDGIEPPIQLHCFHMFLTLRMFSPSMLQYSN
jgi:hypothetical protein